MRTFGSVEKLLQLWENFYRENANETAMFRDLMAFRKEYFSHTSYRRRRYSQNPRRIRTPNFQEIGKLLTATKSLPTELILNLSTQHKSRVALELIKKTKFKTYIESNFLDEQIRNINKCELTLIFRIVQWLCDKCEEDVWAETDFLINLDRKTNSVQKRKAFFEENSFGPQEVKSNLSRKLKTKKPENYEMYTKKLRSLASELNPLMKRRLMLYILHRGTISNFLVKHLFQFAGSVFEVLQRNLTDF